eukprot:UN09417
MTKEISSLYFSIPLKASEIYYIGSLSFCSFKRWKGPPASSTYFLQESLIDSCIVDK